MAISKIFLNVVLIFLLLFSLRLPILFNSTVLAFILSIPLILSSKNILQFYHIFISRYIFRIFVFYILLVSISLLPAIFHLTYDITILKKYIGSFSTIIISIFVYSAIYDDLKNKNTIIIYLIYVFLLQSVIQIFALISPTFLSFVQIFQDPIAREVAEYYQGMRGLALSSEMFFGLSGAYGLIYILFTAYMLNKIKRNYLDLIFFLILVIGSFFVGKTGLIGLIISFLYLLFSKISLKDKIRILFTLFTTTIILIFITFLILPSNLQFLITDKLFPQAFDIFYNYMKSGDANNYSTHRLGEMLSVPISMRDYLFGSGHYTVNGHYYLRTDSGYIRQILYGGLFYFLIVFLYQKAFLLKVNYISFKNKKEKYHFQLLNYSILFYLLILHIKGEIIGTNKMILVMLVFYALSILRFKKKQRR